MIRILYFGRFQKQKGTHLIPQISHLLDEKKIKHRFDLYGSHDRDKYYLKILKESNNCPNVFLHDWIDGKEKEKALREHDIMIVPSIWDEPFGMVVLDAMAHGMPVVASNRGGLTELVEGNCIGICVEPEPRNFVDAIIKICGRK